MNKKIIFSGMSILAALALMGGATFAFFSSSATSSGNVFASGTLQLQLDDNNDAAATTITASIGGPNMAPGDSTSGFISMHNNGTIDIAKVKLGATETVPSSPDLAGQLNITSATIGDDQACSVNPHAVTGLTTLAALNSAPISMNNSAIVAGGTKYLCMTFTLDNSTDNTYQGKTITETFNFEGDQTLGQ